jgi:predicted PurR-regulated permease PerM
VTLRAEVTPAPSGRLVPTGGGRLRRDWPYIVAAGLVTAFALVVLWLAGRALLLVGTAILAATILYAASDGLARLTGLGRRWCLALVCLALLGAAAAAVWTVAPELVRQAGDLAGRGRELWGEFSRRIDDFALGRKALEEIQQ